MASKAEDRIAAILQKNNIRFETEKRFSDLKSGWLRYDFYIPSMNILIEVDGAQHFQYTTVFHRKRSDFTKAQERDREKNSYALAHSIPLYRIPYWDLDIVSTFDDLITKKYRVTGKFHNDNLWREHQKTIKSR